MEKYVIIERIHRRGHKSSKPIAALSPRDVERIPLEPMLQGLRAEYATREVQGPKILDEQLDVGGAAKGDIVTGIGGGRIKENAQWIEYYATVVADTKSEAIQTVLNQSDVELANNPRSRPWAENIVHGLFESRDFRGYLRRLMESPQKNHIYLVQGYAVGMEEEIVRAWTPQEAAATIKRRHPRCHKALAAFESRSFSRDTPPAYRVYYYLG